MKNSNRNVILFIILVVLVVAVYSVIHVYCKRLKTDIYSENAIYENNRKKQPVNNIISIRRDKPVEPTVSPTIEPTVSPTIEPSTKPTSRPTTRPSASPTTSPTPTPTPTPTHHEEITDDIVFEYYYEDGNYIYLINQFPIVDEIGKSLQGERRTQDFKLRFNSAAVGVKYTITAEKLSGSTLDDEWAKMFLVNDGRDVANCYRSNHRVKTFNEYTKYNNKNNERIIYEGIITSSEAARGYKDFTFRMWVSEDLELNNSNYLSESKTYKARINVYATE